MMEAKDKIVILDFNNVCTMPHTVISAVHFDSVGKSETLIVSEQVFYGKSMNDQFCIILEKLKQIFFLLYKYLGSTHDNLLKLFILTLKPMMC